MYIYQTIPRNCPLHLKITNKQFIIFTKKNIYLTNIIRKILKQHYMYIDIIDLLIVSVID